MPDLYPWQLIKVEKSMGTSYDKYPRGFDGDIDRYMMNVILLVEAMTQQRVEVRTMVDPGMGLRSADYEFRFMKDGVSVCMSLPQEKKEMVPSEIVAREVVAQLRGHWDKNVLHNVGGVLAGQAGRQPDPEKYYENQMKKAISQEKITKGPIHERQRKIPAKTGSPAKVGSVLPPLNIPPPEKPAYQKELQKRVDAWLN